MDTITQSKVLYAFTGTRDECEDWLLNMGFLNEHGRFVHPRGWVYKVEPEPRGQNSHCVAQIFRK